MQEKQRYFKSFEEAREFFKKDQFATNAGMYLTGLGDDFSECRVELNEAHQNANGGIMGGVMFTLCDLAFAALANHIHMPTVAQQVSINYLNAPKGKELIARAECKKEGRNSTIINVDVKDDTGRDIAQFVGVGFRL